MEKEDISKNENAPEKNYYWQSFLISFILLVGFIFLLSFLGIYKDERTLGGVPILLSVYFINKFLKYFAKKYGSDLLE